MFSFLKVGLVGLLLAVVMILTNGCGDGASAVKTTIPSSVPSSTQVRVQQIGFDTALNIYSFGLDGFGAQLPLNSDGNGFTALVGKNIAPSLGDAKRGGPSNNKIDFFVYDKDGNLLTKQPVVTELDGTIFRFMQTGRFIVKAFFVYNGKADTELSCWLDVNDDPSRASLTATSSATNVVNETASRLVRIQVSNTKIGTVAHNVRIFGILGAASITGKGTADDYIESQPSVVTFTNPPVLVPGTLRVISMNRGGPGETSSDPTDLNKGILVGDIAGGDYKAIEFKISVDANFIAGEVKLYWPDGTELEKLADGSYFIRENSQTSLIKEVAIGYGKEPVYICFRIPGASTCSGSILAHEGSSWYKWDGQYEYWLSSSSTGFPKGKVTHLTVGAK